MSRPQPPKPAKPIVGFFLKERSLAADIAGMLQARLGPVDMISPWLDFDFTSYYEKEMGAPLFRRLMVFKPLIEQTRLAAIKRMTNELETTLQRGGQRRVNIDPGYLLPERFVLATGKNFTHRIYIGEGIYADLTLIYRKGAFRTLPWTYPDYADRRLIDFLTLVRNKYMIDLKKELARKPDALPGSASPDAGGEFS
ncbi:hypothetical protein DSCO28_72230 [Desulfosarcina ovata subsp. sediminis]|uniref:GTP-binding protein n=1 Tax=Desulfosarcina ovata subsp. sediminis TaxID=885957 RepID=A0A5K8A2D4_9BACT|nr:DUF4416 family protein [Desulfosarcina ovata]BBO86657.1 hypothetical protein DSCO28_72230 [Desulfosarcina ovata subsp. sediminis]